MKNIKTINDPVHGFIAIPSTLILELIEHEWFQRLRRIKQLGLTELVYPGALHTRFHHSIGAMHLAKQALDVLKSKGICINNDEYESTLAAVLLHDIGHCPFSHALESIIVSDANHEDISNILMNELNRKFNNKLTLAIKIFQNKYHKKFLHQLVSSQLDVDRLDYLKRDSFYTGVSEGVINSNRLIDMFNVIDNQLLIEEKAIYSVENFIVARRLMYWQVYYHKTVVAAENMLISIIKRIKHLHNKNIDVQLPYFLKIFIEQKVSKNDFKNNQNFINYFNLLDDYELSSLIKSWSRHNDTILSEISKSLLNRQLNKIVFSTHVPSEKEINEIKIKLTNKKLEITFEDSDYFICTGTIYNKAYNPETDKIFLLLKNGEVKDILQSSEQINLSLLSTNATKYYISYPKLLI